MNFYEAKFLCEYILQKEIKNNGLDVKPYAFGVISYYNQEYFKSKLKLHSFVIKHPDFSLVDKISSFINLTKYSLMPNYKGAYIGNDKSIVVFIDNLIVLPKLKINIIDLLKTTYHEIYHAIDFKNKTESFNFNNYDKFACDLERFLSKHYTAMPFRYLFNHDSFMIEILANKYGIERTIEFINNNPNAYNYDIARLEKLKKKYNNQYNNYNLSKNLDIIIKNYKAAKKSKGFDNSVFEIFLNEDGSFKSLNDIILDSRIFYAFLNTSSYRKSLNVFELSKEAIYVLNQALNYNINLMQQTNISLESELFVEKKENDSEELERFNLLREKSKILDKGILLEKRDKTLKYLKNIGINNQRTINNINSDVQIYSAPVTEIYGCTFMQYDGCIYLDEKFISNPQNKDITNCQITHEFLHGLNTDENNRSYIFGHLAVEAVRKYVGVDEGVTQMITEDIEQKYLPKEEDHYYFLKNIMRIFKVLIGEQKIVNQYLNLGNEFENEVNKVMNDESWFYNFALLMEKYNNLDKKKRQDKQEYKEETNLLEKEILVKVSDLISSKIIINSNVLEELKKEFETRNLSFLNDYNILQNDNIITNNK